MLLRIGLVLLLINIGVAAEEKARPDELITNYVKKWNEYNSQDINKGILKPLTKTKMNAESGDFNGDGLLDWLIYDNDSCGSGGCTAEVYVAGKNERYCFVGTADTYEISKKGKVFPDLKCGTKPIREITGSSPTVWVVSGGFKFPIRLWDKHGTSNAKFATIKLTVPAGKEFVVKRKFYGDDIDEVWFPSDFEGIASYTVPGAYKWKLYVDGELIVESGFETFPYKWHAK